MIAADGEGVSGGEWKDERDAQDAQCIPTLLLTVLANLA
jgi:hypothetical protein